MATLVLEYPGINRFNISLSYHSNITQEPCIIDSKCRMVAIEADTTEDETNTNVRPIPTVKQCLEIPTSFGQKVCLDMVEKYANEPVGFEQTKQQLLQAAVDYDSDPKDSDVRNLFDTILQYRCPLGQKFSLADTTDLRSQETSKNNVVESFNITCHWNQTWMPLINGTSLPNCVGKIIFHIHTHICIHILAH